MSRVTQSEPGLRMVGRADFARRENHLRSLHVLEPENLLSLLFFLGGLP